MSKARTLADFVSAGNPLADGDIDVDDITGLTSSLAEINLLDGVTATTTELNYLSGVTSNIQSQFDGIITDLVSDTTPQLGGDLDTNGNDITGTGNVNITGTITATSYAGVTTSNHILPTINATFDLGSSSYSFRNLYTNDLHLSNEKLDKGNDVDGTKGSWTIQEGADSLYIINNKSGNKYKFSLELVE